MSFTLKDIGAVVEKKPLKILQTKFGKGQGNCLTACVSSITGKPIEELPDFYSHSGIEWWDRLYAWCFKEGYGLTLVKDESADHMLVLNQYGIGVAKLKGIEERHAVILRYSLSSQKDKWHWDAELWHDPNPKKYEIEKIEEHIFINNQAIDAQASVKLRFKIKRTAIQYLKYLYPEQTIEQLTEQWDRRTDWGYVKSDALSFAAEFCAVGKDLIEVDNG